jgi:putative hydrolase of the HAD superfamily
MERIQHKETMSLHARSRIQAVTFDVGGTLIQPWPSVGHVYAQVAAKHGHDGLSPQVLNERFKTAWRTCQDFDYSRTGWETLVNQTFDGLIHSSPSFFPELYERFAEADAWNLFEDVRPILDGLASRDIRLAVISNWDERLRCLLERLRLRDYFETLIISCEVAFAKPSPVIFEQAVARLGLKPESILHVGDSLEMDYQGARNVGFQALHLNRSASSAGESQIRSLADLADRLPIRGR